MPAGISLVHVEVKCTKFDEVGIMFVIMMLLALNKFAVIYMT